MEPVGFEPFDKVYLKKLILIILKIKSNKKDHMIIQYHTNFIV